MIDASRYELDENIRVTREIACACHAMNVGVEAELGKIHGVEDEIAVDVKDASFTDPKEAIRFVQETQVDALAIAVGTAHGPYKGKPELDFERIQTIKQLVDAAIVLHGSSGVGEEDIRRAVELGVNKFNIDTDLRQAFDATLRDFVTQNPAVYDPKKIIGATRPAIQRVAETKIALFGSSKKAW
jgi:fructose-bisphosphate aldolase class II